jgi:hypothetical protein
MGKNPRLRKREFNVDSKKLNMIITSIASLVIVGLGLFGYFSYKSYEDTMFARNREVADLKGRIHELETLSNEVNVKDIQQSLNSATTLGNKVTELQNTWNKGITPEDFKAYDESGHQSVDALNTTRISRLKLMFVFGDTEGSKVWYQKIEGTKSTKSSWKFITTTSFVTAKQNVMWQCTGPNGELYAYVTAVYNSDKDLFESVSVNVTSSGLEAQDAVKGAL